MARRAEDYKIAALIVAAAGLVNDVVDVAEILQPTEAALKAVCDENVVTKCVW